MPGGDVGAVAVRVGVPLEGEVGVERGEAGSRRKCLSDIGLGEDRKGWRNARGGVYLRKDSSLWRIQSNSSGIIAGASTRNWEIV